MSADPEPSMEDILASIRKIIADDADPVPLDGPDATETEGVANVASIEPTLAPAALAASKADTTVDLSSDDASVSNDQPASSQMESLEGSIDIEAFLMDFDAIDSEASDDLTIPASETDEPATVSVSPAPSVEPPAADLSMDDEDDMDRLMDELMTGLADDVVAAPAPDPLLRPNRT